MKTETVIALLLQYGLPLTQQLFAWAKAGKTEVTSEDFDLIVKLGQYRSQDALDAAGVKIENGVVVPK